MDNPLLEPDTRDTLHAEAAHEPDDIDDLLAWSTRDDPAGPFADRRFII